MQPQVPGVVDMLGVHTLPRQMVERLLQCTVAAVAAAAVHVAGLLAVIAVEDLVLLQLHTAVVRPVLLSAEVLVLVLTLLGVVTRLLPVVLVLVVQLLLLLLLVAEVVGLVPWQKALVQIAGVLLAAAMAEQHLHSWYVSLSHVPASLVPGLLVQVLTAA